jgi:hypothetical protein
MADGRRHSGKERTQVGVYTQPKLAEAADRSLSVKMPIESPCATKPVVVIFGNDMLGSSGIDEYLAYHCDHQSSVVAVIECRF